MSACCFRVVSHFSSSSGCVYSLCSGLYGLSGVNYRAEHYQSGERENEREENHLHPLHLQGPFRRPRHSLLLEGANPE